MRHQSSEQGGRHDAGVLDTLADFVPEQSECHIFLAHPTAAKDSIPSITSTFDDTSIEISEDTVPELDQERLVLFYGDELVTTSPAAEFVRLIDAVNDMIVSDTSESLPSGTLPAVLKQLANNGFTVQHSTKRHPELLFTTISRYIETKAYERGEGTIRAGLQRLSRLKRTEESHTRTVYKQLAATDLDVHAYGVPDWIPPESLDMTIHGGYSEDFARNWFVLYQSADRAITAAFVGHERDTGGWHGHWTFDADRVERIDRYLAHNL